MLSFRLPSVLCALTLALSHAPTSEAGDITGTVKLPDPTARPARRTRARYPGEAAGKDPILRGPAVVFLEKVEAGAPFKPPAEKPVLAQKDRQFAPLLLPILVGTVVRFPNQDDEFHNVFSRSVPKELELGRFGKDQVKEETFDKPGLVRLRCEIHTHMHAVILVLQNPHFAVADDQGAYVIPNVPAGSYRLCAFQEDLEPAEKTESGIPVAAKEVEIPAEGKVAADFDLSQEKK